MKYVCDKKYIDLDCVDTELERIGSLLMVIDQNYFRYSGEYAKENPIMVACEYERYSDLVSISVELLRDVRETLSIARQNLEDGDLE